MRLKGALLNVIDHAYNRHGNCSQYFDCPVALGKNTKSSYNAKGDTSAARLACSVLVHVLVLSPGMYDPVLPR